MISSVVVSVRSPNVRFLARSFGVPGNHLGQQSHGFRWPYGPVRFHSLYSLIYHIDGL
ncbi:putative L-glutamate gamma-semialdehyde dehydrogenase [Helianthus anomalus]